jgi:chemotaxis protein methyltransferase CheR
LLNIGARALSQLAALLNERAGLKIAPDGYAGLRLALSQRMPALGLSDAEEYVRRLRELAGERELRSLLPLVTVGKTDFFRDSCQFRALSNRIIPELLLAARGARRKLLIWSAGCATGEEPYSLAIVLAECGATPDDAEVSATDLNVAALETAKLGRFPAGRMRGVSQTRLRRFFHPRGAEHEVDASLRAFIRFEGQNLAAPIFAHVWPESVDLILCRNVIIYFDLPTIRGLMGRFLRAMRPNAYLLLGYSESLFRVYDEFEMVEVDGAFVYRKPNGPPTDSSRTFLVPPAVKIRGPSIESDSPGAPLRPTAAPPPQPQPKGDAAGNTTSAARGDRASPLERLSEAVRRMDRGEFDAALAAVAELTEENPDDLCALLTLGNILSLMGLTAESEETFAKALAREPLCVEAWLFGGVAALQAGCFDDALAQLRKALFLEPTLALGHYLLAQVRERLGDRESARRSYRNAVAQLRFPQRQLAGHYPDLPESPEVIGRVARYALSALDREERPG